MRGIEAAPIELTDSLVRRFWTKVERSDDGCWTWTGARYRNGYGRIYVGGVSPRVRMVAAHRVSYAIHFGPPPIDRAVLHHCDNPSCVRPDHFFLGTQPDNMRDMQSKGRGRKATLVAECLRGHPQTDESTFVTRRGHRTCMECHRLHGRETARRRRARDPERIRQLKRESAARTSDRVAARNAEWYAANRERVADHGRRKRAEKRASATHGSSSC